MADRGLYFGASFLGNDCSQHFFVSFLAQVALQARLPNLITLDRIRSSSEPDLAVVLRRMGSGASFDKGSLETDAGELGNKLKTLNEDELAKIEEAVAAARKKIQEDKDF